MANNIIPMEERIILGCRALAGENVSELSREYDTNREFVYTQKDKVREILNENYNTPKPKEPVLVLDAETIERTVVGCMVICKGSTEDTQEYLDKIYRINISM